VTELEFRQRAASQQRLRGPLRRTVSPRLRRCTGFAPPLADPSTYLSTDEQPMQLNLVHTQAACNWPAASPPALFSRGCPRRSPPLSSLQHGDSTDWCFGGLFRNHAPRFRPAPLALGSPLNIISSPLHSPLCRPRSSSGVHGPRQLSPARRVSLH
jgi:hypothetical protein